MTSSDDNQEPPTAVGPGGEPTTVVPPVDAAPGFAWSYEEPETEALNQPWRPAWRQVVVIAACGLALAVAIGVAVFIAEQASQRTGPPTPPPPPAAPSAPLSASALPPIASAPPSTMAAPAPPVTSTVTVVAPPPAGAGPAPPTQGMFVICPSGHSGVATTVTSCAFADNVRRAYLAQGGPDVEAYSPVTGETYAMECVRGFEAHLSDGQTVQAVRCTGGNNAVVVVW